VAEADERLHVLPERFDRPHRGLALERRFEPLDIGTEGGEFSVVGRCHVVDDVAGHLQEREQVAERVGVVTESPEQRQRLLALEGESERLEFAPVLDGHRLQLGAEFRREVARHVEQVQQVRKRLRVVADPPEQHERLLPFERRPEVRKRLAVLRDGRPGFRDQVGAQPPNRDEQVQQREQVVGVRRDPRAEALEVRLLAGVPVRHRRGVFVHLVHLTGPGRSRASRRSSTARG